MSQPLNLKTLAHLKSVIGDSLAPILRTYLEITPPLVKELEAAIKQANAAEIKRHAHTLKGSSANIGAVDLPSLCLEMEGLGRDGDVKKAEALYPKVNQAYSELETAIKQYLTTQPN